jgi:DUF1009 family protein
MVKVSKPKQDLRFDVPVIGPLTLDAARAARLRVIGVEAGQTLVLDREQLTRAAEEAKISVVGI